LLIARKLTAKPSLESEAIQVCAEKTSSLPATKEPVFHVKLFIETKIFYLHPL